MNNLNLVKLLKLFSKKDLTEFDKFLRSPLFNNQSTLVRLFREIKKYHPGFDHKKLNNNYLFHAVNPRKPFNSLVFRKYISSITKLAEEYLYISRASDDKYRKGLMLLEIYQRAGLYNLYVKKEKEASAQMNVKNKINNNFFQNKMWHSEIMFNYLNKHISNKKSLDAITGSQLYHYLYFIHAYSHNLVEYHSFSYNFKINEDEIYFKKYFDLIDKKYFDDNFCLMMNAKGKPGY